jgi:hypothetical protein
MDEQRGHREMLQERERELERAKLRELERIQQRSDEERERELERLKERARKVDYGSHAIFEQNQNKSLIQKKSE